VYFGGKRVGTVTNGATANFTQDRLGSNGSYYPYGEARGTVPQDDVGFATYTNDSATGLDYADQRYYASNFGRMMSPDPYKASAGPKDPGSWNRYSYVEGDPVNFYDPRGLMLFPAIWDPYGKGPPGTPGGGGGCGAIMNIAADPESGTPGYIDCMFQNFPVPSFANSGSAGSQYGQATQQLLAAMQASPNQHCMGWLETHTGKTASQLDTDATNVQFFNITGSAGNTPLASLGFAPPNGNPDETLAQAFAAQAASAGCQSAPGQGGSGACVVPAVTFQGTPYVMLGFYYFNSQNPFGGTLPATGAYQQAILFHEFFHTEGVGDLGGSLAFDNWLKGGCQGNPPGQ